MSQLLQLALNAAVAGVVAQGNPAFDKDAGGCRYRTEDGMKCAAGFLIPDEDYDPEMEGKSADHHAVMPYISVPNTFENRDFLVRLQGAHDTPALQGVRDEEFVRRFKKMAADVAISFGLTIPKEGKLDE